VQLVGHQSTLPGNASNKNGPARVKQWMQWKAPFNPLAVDDPLLLPEQEVLAEIGRVNPSRVITLGRTPW